VLLPALPVAAQVTLPVGSAPEALSFDHFPSRMHAFIWRNWNLVPAKQLATVLDTTPENVRNVAGAMGLPPEAVPSLNDRARLQLTIIRRNWHLLPYDQILQLLELTPEQLETILREDDFFFIKLGSLKPRCDRLTWAPSDAAVHARCEEIRQLAAAFTDAPQAIIEPPLGFLKELTGTVPDAAVVPRAIDRDHPRFLYSYAAVFGDSLLDETLNPFPDPLLQKLSELGVNGVWLHVVLRDLAPSRQFPEFGQESDIRLKNLARLVARAKRFGVAIYLYMNEPRAMPERFFNVAGREKLAGVREGNYQTLCTSQPEIREWLADSLTHVFKQVPDLGGVFTITASENLTSCASHGHHDACPVCKHRTRAEIIAEVNQTIEQGVHRGNPQASVIVWDWGWKDADAADIIARLPKNVFLQSVSEWSLPIERGGVKTTVGEYSISAVGPGPRAIRHWELARQQGLRTTAKVQANNTWELSSVPYLPAMDLVARHAGHLADQQIDGLQLSWSLGGYPSPNLQVFEQLVRRNAPSTDQVLNALAEDLFGRQAAPQCRAAWTAYSNAFENFPYHISVVYTGPQQFGPSNLLWARPTGYRATMIGFPYDDLERWRGPYPRDTFLTLLEQVSSGFQTAEHLLESAAAQAPPEKQNRAMQELRLAQAARLHFASTANQVRFVILRDQLAQTQTQAQAQTPAPLSAAQTAAWNQILDQEFALAQQLYRLQRQDSRIGFEASNHYYYLPQDLIEKGLNCQALKKDSAGR